MREAERVLRFLRAGFCSVSVASRAGGLVLERDGRSLVVDGATVAGLARTGRVAWNGALLRAAGDEARRDALGAAPQVIEAREEADGTAALVNLAESPLALLARRKAKDGTPFLSAPEARAGERLRADFTRGQLSPRLGVRWDAPLSPGKGHGGGVAELTEAALGSRQRVEGALRAVGPELSGVLVDVCCFLKGLEQVEHERGWPARSAKMLLKSALGALARHYDPRGARRGDGLPWGVDRPKA